jgi:hypothetical protein
MCVALDTAIFRVRYWIVVVPIVEKSWALVTQ